MAVLTNSDYKQMRRYLYQDAAGKAELKADDLTKQQLKDLIQAIEDWYEADKATVKTEMEAAASTTITNTLAKKLAKAWMQWKWGGE